MQTGKMLDQMTALLPYLAPLVEDDEIMALRNEIKDKKSAMDAHEAVMRMFPLVVTKHRNELYGIQRAVFTDRWKYVYNGFDYDELYDLKADPNEMVNRINDPELQPVVRELCRRLWQFAYENSDVLTNDYIMTALAPYGPGILFSSD